jgi:hypothetical protein
VRGELTADFNQAHGQLAEWQAWIARPENQLLFRKTYLDWIWDFSGRPLIPHYILVYGRRAEFENDHTGTSSIVEMLSGAKARSL